VVINNRPHLSTEMVSIVGDSVMNGLLYPLSHVSTAFPQLDQLPAPASHPTVNGQNVSAFHPLAVNAHNFGGMIRAPRMEGKKVINELVIDIEVANKDERGKEIVRRIEAGESIGVSTGLNATVTNQAGKEGEAQYKGIVSNIKFDHVAVLPNEAPAGGDTFTINSDKVMICNVSECVEVRIKDPVYEIVGTSTGLTNQEVDEMDKDKIVLAIISNAANTYTSADKDSLMAMSEIDLINGVHLKVVHPAPTVDTAQEVLIGAGMTVNSKDFDADGYAKFIDNKTDFDKFLENKKALKAEMVESIIENSKMTKEQIENMPNDAIESLANSFGHEQNYSVQNQSVANNDRSTTDKKVDYSH